MQKSVMVDEVLHKKLKQKASASGMSIKHVVDRLVAIADQRVKMAFQDSTVPVPEGVGIPFLPIYVGLHLVDCGIISKKEFQLVIKNYGRVGDSFLIAGDMEPAEAVQYFENLALEDNFSE